MRWKNRRRSQNIDDRRGQRRAGGKVGLGGLLVAVAAGYFFGIDPAMVITLLEGQSTVSTSAPAAPTERSEFVSVILADTEDVWADLAPKAGIRYQDPTLVMFTGSTPTQCGQGQSAMGPFYCSLDQSVYIDLGFFDTLARQLGAPGDFAQAYVIAHEVGHHVQNLQGTLGKVRQAKQRLSSSEGNALQVAVELQADCYAGLWAKVANDRYQMLDGDDLAEAMLAAHKIGDDTLAKNAGRAVVPESFTHGSSEQRKAWFLRGFQVGTVESCNTFSG
ncbi:MAG: neutral zinc metallopeptidase [Gammaproteobacteria bacterium]|nr:neutral zinc metallopeptidase [Gammaproteobacteria bacterium]